MNISEFSTYHEPLYDLEEDLGLALVKLVLSAEHLHPLNQFVEHIFTVISTTTLPFSSLLSAMPIVDGLGTGSAATLLSSSIV